jgi:predicted signal transduction protein with EAL and GGDEF domain
VADHARVGALVPVIAAVNQDLTLRTVAHGVETRVASPELTPLGC